MENTYQNNLFIQSLPKDIRKSLDNKYTIRKFPKGYRFSVKDMSSLLYLIVDGLIVYSRSDDSAKEIKTIEIAGPGSLSFLSEKSVFCTDGSHCLYCMLDTAIAVFDQGTVKRLKERDGRFAECMYDNLMNFVVKNDLAYYEKVGIGSAEEAVRFILDFCKEYRLPQLTHEQIAILTNRRRPTVTKVMNRILKA